MKKCPKCNHELLKIDNIVPYIEKSMMQPTPFIAKPFFMIICALALHGLDPGFIKYLVLFIFYLIGSVYLYKAYKKDEKTSVYECIKCKELFLGPLFKPFNYREWSKKEYNKKMR